MKEYRNVTKTKKAIRGVFTDMLNEKQDITKISVNALCERADVAKSTFYYHYVDIYAVAEEFENELIDALSQAIDAFQADRMADVAYYVGKVTEFLKENEEMYRKVICADITGPFIEKLKNIIEKKIFSQIAGYPFSSDPTQRRIQTRVFTNACIDTVADYFRGTLQCSLDEIAAVVLQMIEKITDGGD